MLVSKGNLLLHKAQLPLQLVRPFKGPVQVPSGKGKRKKKGGRGSGREDFEIGSKEEDVIQREMVRRGL